MFTCPTCGRGFETRRGLGVHHSSVHGERLPNRTCERCGEEFYCEYRKKYCSSECRSEAVSFAGENHPNYQGKKERTNCVLCDAEFEYYPSNKEGLYCPTCVETEQWRDPPSQSGTENPRWAGGKTAVECDVGGDSVERYPSNIGDVVLCGEDCRRTWLSEAFTGEGHPNWKGGGNENYGEGWNAVRQAALERDGYRCVHCGITAAEMGRNPDVHHIVPVRAFVEAETLEKTDAHALENVVSLCIPCHRKAEFGRIEAGTLRAAIDGAGTANA
ncbi:HNH endonuclease [Natrialbaceae archaeon GCM10025810]|uniref:HNH endonuclease n=1 Tax=Halovalidus salilacus TaxID=3075124 RepID=UPI00360B1290